MARVPFVAGTRLPRRGQLLSVKAIAYLVLSVISVIAAFMLLVRIYQAIIGGSPEQQDAALLASTISTMLADDRPYMQLPILLRLEDKRIVGFDSGAGVSIDTLVSAGSGGSGGAAPPTVKRSSFERSATCGEKPCVCTASDSATKSCYVISVPNSISLPNGKKVQPSLTLATNYYPYENSVGPKYGTVDAFKAMLPANAGIDQKGIYTQFIIDRENIEVLKITTRKGPVNSVVKNQDIAIIPLLIEKLTDDQGNILITVMPDSDQMRGREVYLYRCPEGGDAQCTGKTFQESYSSTDKKACSASVLHPECRYQKVPDCETNKLVSQPCNCRGSIALSGVCFGDGERANLRCDFISTCEDYCTNTAGDKCAAQATVGFCEGDPCHVAGVGQKCHPPNLVTIGAGVGVLLGQGPKLAGTCETVAAT